MLSRLFRAAAKRPHFPPARTLRTEPEKIVVEKIEPATEKLIAEEAEERAASEKMSRGAKAAGVAGVFGLYVTATGLALFSSSQKKSPAEEMHPWRPSTKALNNRPF